MLKQIGLLTAAAIFMIMINIDYTAVNLALVTISKDIHSDLDTIRWLLSGYTLAWAAMIVPAGKVADIYGRKKICLLGLLLFILGSLFAGLANSVGMMILGRVFQGLAGALAIPTIYAFLYATFPKEKIGFALGILSLGIGLGMALGPTFGGVVLTYMGWRWIFFINIPLGIILFGLLLWSTQEKRVIPNDTLDILSSILLSLGVVGLLYSIGEGSDWGWSSLLFLAILFLSLSSLLLFIYRQFKHHNPLISLSIFRNRHFVGSAVTLAIEQFAFTAVIVGLALYLQKIAGFSALTSSFIFLALSLMTGIISPFGGVMIGRFGFIKPAIAGQILMIAGMLGLAMLSTNPSIPLVCFVLVIIGMGMGFALTALQTGTLSTVSETEVGVASGVFIMLALLGNASSVIITTLIYQTKALSKLFQLINSHGDLIETKANLSKLVTHLGSTNQHVAHHQLTMALKSGFDLAILVATAMIVLGMGFFGWMMRD